MFGVEEISDYSIVLRHQGKMTNSDKVLFDIDNAVSNGNNAVICISENKPSVNKISQVLVSGDIIILYTEDKVSCKISINGKAKAHYKLLWTKGFFVKNACHIIIRE